MVDKINSNMSNPVNNNSKKDSYTVKNGDTVRQIIIKKYGTTIESEIKDIMKDIKKLNPGRDLNKIQAGMTIKLPETTNYPKLKDDRIHYINLKYAPAITPLPKWNNK